MRPKIILSAVVLAFAILAPVIYFHFKPDSPAETPAPVVADNTPAPAPGESALLKRVSHNHSSDTLPDHPADLDSDSDADAGPVDHDTVVARKVAKLTELGMQNDPDSLKVILSELQNSEPDIRHAALNATVQFGSKDALPQLQTQLQWASDPQEKVDIQKAINFLQLPSFTSDSGSITQESSDNTAPAAN